MSEFYTTKDNYGANIYYLNIDNINIELTLDWTFDSIYFKYDKWIILSTGTKGIGTKGADEFHKLIPEEIVMFKKIAFYALNTFKPFSPESEKCLNGLRKIVDMYV